MVASARKADPEEASMVRPEGQLKAAAAPEASEKEAPPLPTKADRVHPEKEGEGEREGVLEGEALAQAVEVVEGEAPGESAAVGVGEGELEGHV